uniref:THAP domain containing 1 n=1 Tax=Cyprinus carpio TaxID=7962 RepID=A0A8C1PBN1_CYPCA
MVQSCSAYGCKNRYHKDKNISFHKFPLARPDVCGSFVAGSVKLIFVCSQAASLEESFSPDLAFPLSLPLSAADETPSEAQPGPDLHTSAFVSCDHNYTVEDTVQQKRRIEQLQEQLEKLRKRLKTVQQKCRRQERQLERFRAMSEVQKPGKDAALGESYVILPKEIYDVLKGIETIGAS